MSKSLNQAFIKAYSKEKSSGQRSTAPDTQEGPVHPAESLMMRFDTMNVAVPRPHLLQRQQQSEKVAAEALSQANSAAGRTPPPIVDAHPGPEMPERELRESIASQMMRAGHWEDQHWDTFLGGFPMLSTVHTPQSMLEQSAFAKAKDSSTAAPQAAASKSGLSPLSTAAKPELTRPVEPSASLPPQKATHEEPPSLVPPEAPAILPLESNVRTVGAAEDSRGTSRDGEIFRLDRPTYSATSHPERDAEQDSDEQSSLLDVPLEQKTDAGLEPLRSPHAKLETRRVEEDLRKAKVRIFNPVWEVDNLQWPEVCLELLDHNAADVERVAQNLISACQEGLQVLAITSPHSGEGKTTVACCLAILAGSRGLKVAILDGDIENPSLSLQTNLEVDQDWMSAIVNQMPLEEVAVHSIDDQVTIVPLLKPIGQSEMASDDDRIAFMLQELSESFDLVIVDMGHMESQRNLVTAMAEHGIISAVVAVVDRRSTTQQHVEACIRRIRQSGVASIGLIENFAA